MDNPRLLLLPLALLVFPSMALASDTAYAAQGKSIQLKCMVDNKVDLMFTEWQVVYDKDKVTESLHKDQTSGAMQVLDDGWTLYISPVNEGHYGPYRCVYTDATSGERMTYTVTLAEKNESTFEKFRLSIIVSLVACAAALIILGAICITYNYRWERRHGHDAKTLVDAEQASAAHPDDDGGATGRSSYYENGNYVNDKGEIDTIVSSSHL